jgi:hypothetical protein
MVMLLLILHIGDCFTQTVDMLETNHVYSAKGDHCFTQVIAWMVDPVDGRMHNVGWRFVRHRYEWPMRNGKLWYLRIEHGVVTSTHHIVRHLNFDIERENSQSHWKGVGPNVFQWDYRTLNDYRVEVRE